MSLSLGTVLVFVWGHLSAEAISITPSSAMTVSGGGGAESGPLVRVAVEAPIIVAVPAVAVVGAGARLAGGRRFPTIQLGAVTPISVGVGFSRDGAVQVSAMATVVAVVAVLLVVDTELAGVSSAVALIAGSLGAAGRFASPAIRGI